MEIPKTPLAKWADISELIVYPVVINLSTFSNDISFEAMKPILTKFNI